MLLALTVSLLAQESWTSKSPDGEFEVRGAGGRLSLHRTAAPDPPLWTIAAQGSGICWDIASPGTRNYPLYISRNRQDVVEVAAEAPTADSVILRFYSKGSLVREVRLADLGDGAASLVGRRPWFQSHHWTVSDDNDGFIVSLARAPGGTDEQLHFEPWTGRMTTRSRIVATVSPRALWAAAAAALIAGVALTWHLRRSRAGSPAR